MDVEHGRTEDRVGSWDEPHSCFFQDGAVGLGSSGDTESLPSSVPPSLPLGRMQMWLQRLNIFQVKASVDGVQGESNTELSD